MITVEQIKAARGLLEWTQDNLADAAIISRPALNNLERRQTRPHTKTLSRIQKALEKAGIEFIDGGVRFRQQVLNVQTLEGDSAIHRWMEDVFNTINEGDKTILISGVNEQEFIQYGGNRFLEQLENFHAHNIKSKLLIRDGDTNFIEPPGCYRWVSDEIFSQIPYAVYGDKYAILLWKPLQKIVIIQNAAIAQSYRQQFDVLWKNARSPASQDQNSF